MTDHTLTLEQIEAWEEKCRAATPGTWHKQMICLGPNGSGPMTLGVGSKTYPICIVHGIVESPRGQRDAAFIAASDPQKVLALLSVARERLQFDSALEFISRTDTALIGRPFARESIMALAKQLGWRDPSAKETGT